jgi:hypothetical protein
MFLICNEKLCDRGMEKSINRKEAAFAWEIT